MEDDVIRILVTTDNHLGVHERDAVRADDAAAAFEEALVAARRLHADFVLLAGDTFHENKPSRRALHDAFALFNKYCLGDSPVYIEVLNDQAEIFKANGGQVNYESPNQAIAMPVFAIHGNHDDPSREGGREALAALDLLSSCNLVNYIGKAAQVDDIEISPVLIRKGTSLLALYSLGAVRDERLNRMWNQQKVRFIRPTVEQVFTVNIILYT
jgi:double-strand break repair protein MRE11